MWTAPEQMRADDVPHPRADVFALGLLTFFILTGKVYWKHAQGKSSMVQLSMELVRAPIERPSVRAAELGLPPFAEGFDDWFLRCVNRDGAARYENAGAALGGDDNGDSEHGRAVIVLEDVLVEDAGEAQVAVHASFFPQLEDRGGEVLVTPAQAAALELLEAMTPEDDEGP